MRTRTMWDGTNSRKMICAMGGILQSAMNFFDAEESSDKVPDHQGFSNK